MNMGNLRKRIERLEAQDGLVQDREKRVGNLAAFMGMTVKEIMELTQGHQELRYCFGDDRKILWEDLKSLCELSEATRGR